jgi:ADP-heptose:LPS heptosyltransferase
MAGVFPILFVAPSRIGDAVLCSGLLKRLADEIPNAAFTIAAGPISAPLFRDLPGLQRLVVVEKEKGGGHWLKLWRQTRGRRWGLIVDMRGSGLAGMLSARKRAVYKRREDGGEPVHKVIEAARVLNVEDEPPSPHLFVSPETQAAADALLRLDKHPTAPILAMGPSANWSGKAWPPERFAVAAAELLDSDGPLADGRLLLLGSDDDKETSRTVKHAVPRPRVIDLTGQVDLLTAFAALKRARLYVGNDSGLMHMAAAAGVPTLGLFGPSDERLYGPWGRYTRALRGPRDFETFKKLDPNLNQPLNHMGDLSVDTVLNAAKRLFAETEGAFALAPPEPAASPVGEQAGANA